MKLMRFFGIPLGIAVLISLDGCGSEQNVTDTDSGGSKPMSVAPVESKDTKLVKEMIALGQSYSDSEYEALLKRTFSLKVTSQEAIFEYLNTIALRYFDIAEKFQIDSAKYKIKSLEINRPRYFTKSVDSLRRFKINFDHAWFTGGGKSFNYNLVEEMFDPLSWIGTRQVPLNPYELESHKDLEQAESYLVEMVKLIAELKETTIVRTPTNNYTQALNKVLGEKQVELERLLMERFDTTYRIKSIDPPTDKEFSRKRSQILALNKGLKIALLTDPGLLPKIFQHS